jgi:hypothetical protein
VCSVLPNRRHCYCCYPVTYLLWKSGSRLRPESLITEVIPQEGRKASDEPNPDQSRRTLAHYCSHDQYYDMYREE